MGTRTNTALTVGVLVLCSVVMSVQLVFGLTLVTLAVSLWTGRLQFGAKATGASVTLVDGNNGGEDAGVKAVLDSSDDLLCIYSNHRIQVCSYGFYQVTQEIETFWEDFLQEDCLQAFNACVVRTLNGSHESLTVRIKSSPTSVLPLSPILNWWRDWKHSNLLLRMRPIHYQSTPSVFITAKPERHSASFKDFIKTLNHEFRTPLNVIIGLCDLILSDDTDRNELLTNRQRLIKQCAYTLLATISGVIQQCEIEWKVPTSLHHTAFDPDTELQSVLNSLSNKLEMRNNRVNLTIEPDFPKVVWGNVSQFRQVMSFLLSTVTNMTSNDTVRLKLAASRGVHRYDLKGHIEAACPAVCSHGEFRSILQMLTAPLEEEGETGYSVLRFAEQQALLHLSIAQEMCRLFCGELQVKDSSTLHLQFNLAFSTRPQYILKRRGNIYSDSDEFVKIETVSSCPSGDSFDHFDLNLAQTSPALTSPLWTPTRRTQTVPNQHTTFDKPPSNHGDSPIIDAHSKEVVALIAEDIPMNAMVLSQMIQRLGLRTVIVENGAKAVEYVRREKVDMVFMDCDMPVMDGLEATQRLRAMGVTVPIVAVTANGPDREMECKNAGMDYFISKPVRFAGLQKLIERLLLK